MDLREPVELIQIHPLSRKHADGGTVVLEPRILLIYRMKLGGTLAFLFKELIWKGREMCRLGGPHTCTEWGKGRGLDL